MHIDEKYLGSCISCSYEEKLECVETVNIILNFLTKYKNNLLDVEDEIENSKYPTLLKIGIRLVMCHEPIELVEKTMYNYIIVGDYKGKELLKSLIIIQSIILLAQGDMSSNLLLPDLYFSCLGLDFMKDFDFK